MTGPEMREESIEEGPFTMKRFESAWTGGCPEPIERFLPDAEDRCFLPALEALVGIELACAWKSWRQAEQRTEGAGQAFLKTIVRPPSVEAYLKRFPQLDQPEILLRLVQQERTVRQQCGEPASIDDYRQRFPSLEIDDLPQKEGQAQSMLPMFSECSVDAQSADTQDFHTPRMDAGGGAADLGIPPGQFGNYELLEEIGRGGMGIVYRARQLTADRIVALKVIRRDRLESLPRDTQTATLDRFRHEAQAAARLEHEHIVTVYEVGDVNGQPFFSMRFVDGRTLAEMLKDGPIENRRAAGYLEPVARAVHEAHSQGILHRDLKPQNIPVDAKSDRALVADFGLAKLAEGGEELTREGEIMGTPSYMSPEQAKDSAGVTAHTDTYALGATLYHILTGRPPFQAANPLETLRQVIDEEPAPPRQVNPSIDLDLDTICLKCLQKEPARRYATAEALADDLRRYLDGRPILARPIGTLGRTWRWCRRNPAMATLAGLFVTMLIVALAVNIMARLRTEAALNESEASFMLLQGAVNDFYRDVSEETLLNRPGMQPLRRELLEKAQSYFLQFIKLRGNDPKLRDDLAMAHFRIGSIAFELDSPEKALGSYEVALKLQEQLASDHPHDPLRSKRLGDTHNAIGRACFRMGDLQRAHGAYEDARKVRKPLALAAPKEGELQRGLANTYMNLGLVARDSGRFKEARDWYVDAQEIRSKSLAEGHQDPQILRDLGMGHYNLGTLAVLEYEALFKEASARGEKPDKDVLADLFTKAIDRLDSAKTDFVGLLDRDPEDLENQLADLFTKAIDSLDSAKTVFAGLLDRDPEDLENQEHLVVCYRILADLIWKVDKDAAMELYQEALPWQQRLASENPAVSDYQFDLAQLHLNIGLLEDELGDSEAALVSLEEAKESLATAVERHKNVPEIRFQCAVALGAIAQCEANAGQDQEALANLETAVEHLNALVKEFPDADKYATRLEQTRALRDKLKARQAKEGQETGVSGGSSTAPAPSPKEREP